MATARVRRGRKTQDIVADYLQSYGWDHAEGVPASLSGMDIKGVAGVAIEVKARKDFSPMAWLKQAKRNSKGGLPVVVMRPNGVGPAAVNEWPVFLTLQDFVHLLKDAGYQGGETKSD